MKASLLQPAGNLSQTQVLELARQAPFILRSNPKAFSSSPLAALFSAPESTDLWIAYENVLLSSLKVGDVEAAHQVLERLVSRFGVDNERVLAFQGLVKEAEATNDSDLGNILREYDALLEKNGTNVPIAKRRTALLRSMGNYTEAIAGLNALLDFSPTDAEAWAELADMYLSQGLYSQAIFALEEVVVCQANSWNAHARLGEVQLMAANVNSEGNAQKYLAEALKRFCRSVELCDDYLRGYYGLKLVTDKLLSGSMNNKKELDGFVLPSLGSIQKLNQTATEKLAEIVRRNQAQERRWQGYDKEEIAAAKILLANSPSRTVY